MNAETPQAPAAPAPAAPASSAESPGTLIRAARERAKLTLADFASQTKLAITTLDALERDDFAALLEPVYVRGYYRKCAKVLNIPEPQLMAAYATRVQPKPTTPPAKLRLGTGSEGGGRRFSGVLLVALLAVLIGVVVWYLRGEKTSLMSLPISAPPATSESPAVTSPDSAPPTSSNATGEEAGYSAAPSAGNTVTPAASSETAAPASVEAQPARPAASAPITTQPGGSQLLLNFVSISWARVADADGKVLLNRVVQAGERQVLEGKPPYAVFLGNAPGVQLQYQGAAVDIKALIRDSATARFSVPLASQP
ncbi:MAG: Cytoskeleton protein RodZ [Hydrocarboniphaga sp.]|uniref:RodZ domain-containing protein n=1 Tax=Hydrocarboniphaga sp. TaxID=2033016 RepID=UPI0026048EDC|nr:RodZ domain-containing protein [Hydrocarboniphaga sp.]MDB5971086.1 Cytoskeleton protein RodZ [Hydrocarboniphaga sp.]